MLQNAHDTREPVRPFYAGSVIAGSQASMSQIGPEVAMKITVLRTRKRMDVQHHRPAAQLRGVF
eukprot:4369091-Prorocentrum_lima.AAC.1